MWLGVGIVVVIDWSDKVVKHHGVLSQSDGKVTVDKFVGDMMMGWLLHYAMEITIFGNWVVSACLLTRSPAVNPLLNHYA